MMFSIFSLSTLRNWRSRTRGTAGAAASALGPAGGAGGCGSSGTSTSAGAGGATSAAAGMAAAAAGTAGSRVVRRFSDRCPGGDWPACTEWRSAARSRLKWRLPASLVCIFACDDKAAVRSSSAACSLFSTAAAVGGRGWPVWAARTISPKASMAS
ncbi:MAG: hypothetical protein ABII93_01445 [Chrysiogenia bacterium]